MSEDGYHSRSVPEPWVVDAGTWQASRPMRDGAEGEEPRLESATSQCGGGLVCGVLGVA